MSPLASVNKYFWKYRWHFLLGMVFIILSNYFRILTPQITKYVLNMLQAGTPHVRHAGAAPSRTNYDPLVQWFIHRMNIADSTFNARIFYSGITLLVLALISGFFMFLMRQTIIVMSRHIEYDQKNEIFHHYQQLDMNFYKSHFTGDLMNRISEDVSRVRMYTGPAVMYLVNLAVTIGFSLYYMFRENRELTIYVLSPLPILAITIYYVNNIINKKSDRIQALLSDLTTNAQESYSGIRVIKSFVQEKAMLGFFENNSEQYRQNAISLAKTEAIYFPSMGLMIGISTLLTILIGGLYVINGTLNIGVIGEFVMYILMLTFPVMAIGWVASMIQRAITSQRRINEFLLTQPTIKNEPGATPAALGGHIRFDHVDFVYPNTGIHALRDFDLTINKGEKVAIIGRTGSGKSTIAQLMLRMYDPQKGRVLYDGTDIRHMDLQTLRRQIAYVPQDVFLFSDTVENNIGFSYAAPAHEQVLAAARNAAVAGEIEDFPQQYQTVIGERGVTLSGGQKQRLSIARALLTPHEIVLFDDCLSAVDARTENEIISNLYNYLHGKTAVIITHRIFSLFSFDRIIVLVDGAIAEQGTHRELMALDGVYSEMYYNQQQQETSTPS